MLASITQRWRWRRWWCLLRGVLRLRDQHHLRHRRGLLQDHWARSPLSFSAAPPSPSLAAPSSLSLAASLGLLAFGLEGSSGCTAGALAFGGGLFRISGGFGEGPNTESPTPANRAAALARIAGRAEVFRSSHELHGTLKRAVETQHRFGDRYLNRPLRLCQEKGLRDSRPPQSIVAREGSLRCRRTTLYSGHSQFLDPPMDRDLPSKSLCCSLYLRENLGWTRGFRWGLWHS